MVECCVVSDDVLLLFVFLHKVCNDHVYDVLFMFWCEQVISSSCGGSPCNSAKKQNENVQGLKYPFHEILHSVFIMKSIK